MTDLIALLNHAQAEADDLMGENERLKRTLERLDATKDEIERAEIIVALRTELQRQKAQNDLLLSLLKQAQTQNVAPPKDYGNEQLLAACKVERDRLAEVAQEQHERLSRIAMTTTEQTIRDIAMRKSR